ncbi:hypothetical protein BCV69DRAFT_211687 [Microstroma glucosiphilum]|uniref:Uncharacterized protein n=1 Tax=Pseudomicrostroma glucosiphilum TaxID=1684307 RepID=A0A316U7T7_9BASI|nr:hypothetical protein BCV69DRAFT_211687 [Pseudomicrostroma glucosiphilum]PWN20511.1 hypothetical protein BCV69DRAFT_211687 [Pseudomicrostroma glucosiphilum]
MSRSGFCCAQTKILARCGASNLGSTCSSDSRVATPRSETKPNSCFPILQIHQSPLRLPGSTVCTILGLVQCII